MAPNAAHTLFLFRLTHSILGKYFVSLVRFCRSLCLLMLAVCVRASNTSKHQFYQVLIFFPSHNLSVWLVCRTEKVYWNTTSEIELFFFVCRLINVESKMRILIRSRKAFWVFLVCMRSHRHTHTHT